MTEIRCVIIILLWLWVLMTCLVGWLLFQGMWLVLLVVPPIAIAWPMIIREAVADWS